LDTSSQVRSDVGANVSQENRGLNIRSSDNALAWRVEDACFKAWPALREATASGWLLRFADGLTRRSNSANPMAPGSQELRQGIAACAARYKAESLPVLFRVPSFMAHRVEDELQRLGYGPEGESRVLSGAFKSVPRETDPNVEITQTPTPEWLTSMAQLQGQSDSAKAIYGKIVNAISVPTAFTAYREQGCVVAMAYERSTTACSCVNLS
jgi:hypothetical protein